ncbi:MAG: SCO family protein [Acidimicrobiia bacterium]|nr:SCO family protein [Acidimicrobiia bacterium]
MRRLLLVLVVAALAAVACSSEPQELSGFVRSPLPDVSAASLPDVSDDGVALPMQAPPGEILVLYFGYTACPDVCPTTLADVRSALRRMGSEAEKIRLAMTTIDPDRDTDEVITGYVQSFVSGAHALRTDNQDELRGFADVFGADYGVSVSEDGDYEVFHTAHLYAIDDEGLLRVTWPFGTDPESISADLALLLEAG